MDLIKEFLSSIQFLTNSINTISSAGVGAVLFTWARVFGIKDDSDFSGFRKPLVLSIPLVAFCIAVTAGYVISAAKAGYYSEVVTGINATNGSMITDKQLHFQSDYIDFFAVAGLIQLTSSLFGIFSISTWYAVNIYWKYDHAKVENEDE